MIIGEIVKMTVMHINKNTYYILFCHCSACAWSTESDDQTVASAISRRLTRFLLIIHSLIFEAQETLSICRVKLHHMINNDITQILAQQKYFSSLTNCPFVSSSIHLLQKKKTCAFLLS